MKPKFEKYTSQGSTPLLKHFRQLDKSELFYFRLVTTGGAFILSSDGYPAVETRDKAIAAVKVFAGSDDNYDRCQNPQGKWYFTLRSGNMGIVGTSPAYDTQEEMEESIFEVRSIANFAVIEEADYK